jgi:hypothetical protein
MTATAENPVSLKYVAIKGSKTFTVLSDKLTSLFLPSSQSKFICNKHVFQAIVKGRL